MFIIRPRCKPSHQIQKNTYVGGCFMFEKQNAKCKRTKIISPTKQLKLFNNIRGFIVTRKGGTYTSKDFSD